jgi:hypothetical protein
MDVRFDKVARELEHDHDQEEGPAALTAQAGSTPGRRAGKVGGCTGGPGFIADLMPGNGVRGTVRLLYLHAICWQHTCADVVTLHAQYCFRLIG